MEDTRLLTETVADLVRNGETELLRRVLESQRPEDLADLLEHVDPDVRDAAFEAMAPQQAGHTVVLLDDTVREELLEDLPAARLADMAFDLETDDAVTLLEDTAPDLAADVLRRLDPEDAIEVRELLGYEDESAGRAMAFGAPVARQEMTLRTTIEALRVAADELDEVQAIFVVDGAGRLLGYIPLDVLLLRPEDTPVLEAMRTDVTFAYVDEDQEAAASRARRAGLSVIPIIDARGILRGQITADRLREIEEEEASEDMYRMVGLSEDESVYSSFGFSLKKRLPWLVVNLMTAFLAAWVISFFEKTIERVAILAALQSIVAGQGGNAGIQTLTIVVRGLALGHLDWRNARRTFYKELGLGVANGAAVGAAVALAVLLWNRNLWLAGVIGAAMLLNMVAAAVAGFSVPLALRALKLDPAQASGVFVTTVTDICGFFFFLGLATLVLNQLPQ